MKTYTGMYIIHPTLTEEQIQTVIADMTKLFEDHDSQVAELNVWGMRDLAYEIQDVRKGYYVKFKVNATVEAINEFNRICNIKEEIMRHIIVND
jgi:small subunit ribosomal protein S6